jgi:hypothetical protein
METLPAEGFTGAPHVTSPPEWAIGGSSSGFLVQCDCGWSAGGFDTASRARSAAFVHEGRTYGEEDRNRTGRRRLFGSRRR